MDNKINNFKDLDAWQEGHKLVLLVYKITTNFPKSEMFGLTSQLRRACVSITSNIAEGFGRRANKDKASFYVISISSLYEVQSQIEIAKDLNFINRDEYVSIVEQSTKVNKIITGLIKYVRQ